MTPIESLLLGWIYLFGLFVAVTVIWRILMWLSTVIKDAYNHLSDILTVAIIGGLRSLFHLSLQLLTLVAIAISSSIARITAECWEMLLEELKLWQLYWKYGRAEFNSFRSFRKAMRGEEDEQDDTNEDREREDNNHSDNTKQENKEQTKKPSDYQNACSLLGLPKNENFTQKEFKLRYRKLISKHHPDKGSKSPEMAQRINDAAKTIKQRRNWR